MATLEYQRPGNGFAPCPNCGSANAKAVTFTWWGGLVGPKMFTHVKCQSCRTGYNGKTGRPNTVPIIMYVTIASLVSVGLLVLWWVNR